MSERITRDPVHAHFLRSESDTPRPRRGKGERSQPTSGIVQAQYLSNATAVCHVAPARDCAPQRRATMASRQTTVAGQSRKRNQTTTPARRRPPGLLVPSWLETETVTASAAAGRSSWAAYSAPPASPSASLGAATASARGNREATRGRRELTCARTSLGNQTNVAGGVSGMRFR